VVVRNYEPVTLTEYDIEDMIEADRKKIEEQFGDYGFEEMVESIEPDEEGNRDYLTVIEDEVKSDAKEDSEVYKLDESERLNILLII